MTVILSVAISQNVTKVERVVFELCAKYVSNCGVKKRGTFYPGEGAHKLDRYPFRKMKNQILHNFHLNVFFFYDGY